MPYLEDLLMVEWVNRRRLLADIDEVMNNRDISSIRNAIIAVRNKVMQAPYRRASFPIATRPRP